MSAHTRENNELVGRPSLRSWFLEPDERKIHDLTPEEMADRQKGLAKLFCLIMIIVGVSFLYIGVFGGNPSPSVRFSATIFGGLVILFGIGVLMTSLYSGIGAGVGAILMGVFFFGAVWLIPENSDKILPGSVTGAFFIIGGAITVGASALRKHAPALEQVPKQGGLAQIEGECVYCDYPIRSKGYKFCPSCGARLITLRGGESRLKEGYPTIEMKSTVPKSNPIEICSVCGQGLKKGGDIFWCPYCGKPAHRAHLLQWVHENSSCPSCGRQLDEKRLSQESPVAGKTSGRSKRSTAQKEQ